MKIGELRAMMLYEVVARVTVIRGPTRTLATFVEESAESDERTFFVEAEDVDSCLEVLRSWQAERRGKIASCEVTSCRPVSRHAVILAPRDGELFSCAEKLK